jgi:hypothetical protein
MPVITIDDVISNMPKNSRSNDSDQIRFLKSQTSPKGGNLFRFCSQDNWQDAALRAANAFFVKIGEQPSIKDEEKIGYGLIALAGQNPHFRDRWKRYVWEKNPPRIIEALISAVLAAGNIATFINNLPDDLKDMLNKSNNEQSFTHESDVAECKQRNFATHIENDMESIRIQMESQRYFDANNEADARKRILTSIVQRAGQTRFREQLLEAYGNRCAITECDVAFALEAAHIIPYKGEHSNDVRNGLLLRADIHTLFDLKKLSINPENYCVLLADEIRETTYSQFYGKQIKLPKEDILKPDKEALDKHFKESAIWVSASIEDNKA